MWKRLPPLNVVTGWWRTTSNDVSLPNYVSPERYVTLAPPAARVPTLIRRCELRVPSYGTRTHAAPLHGYRESEVPNQTTNVVGKSWDRSHTESRGINKVHLSDV